MANRTCIDLDERRDLPIVLYPEGFLGRDIVEEIVCQCGCKLHSVLETSSVTSSIMNLMKANIGATVQPYPLIRQICDPVLHTIRIKDGALSCSLSIIYHSDRYLSRAAKAFIEQIQESTFKASPGV
ncbi:LysR family transcriptional regulator substrate-binding protein [Brevibacillus laterosporus]|uniref:LysR family transcriptional regulator substrate-binding protein n=1 Tax=Brevibacillus laterosporus TaxID=1465 RepID=UPI0030B98AA3